MLCALTRVLSVLIASMASTYLESLIQVCRKYTYSNAKPYVAYRSACALEHALARYEIAPGLIRRGRLVLDEFYGLPTLPPKSMSEAGRREAARAHCQRAALTAVCEASYSLSPTQPRLEAKQDQHQPTTHASFEADQVTTKASCQTSFEADQVTTKASCQTSFEADQVTGRARIEADQVTGRARIEADQVTHQARIEADQVTHQARIEADQVTHQATIEADQVTHQATIEADQVTGQAMIGEVTTERIAQLAVQHYDQMALRGAVFDASCESRMESREVPAQPSEEDRQPGTVVVQKIRAILEAVQPTNQPSNHPTPTNPTTCDVDQPTDQPTPTNQASCEADQATNQPSQPNLSSFEAKQPTDEEVDDEEVDQDQASSQTPKPQSVAWSLADQVVATLFVVVLSNVVLKRLCQEKYVPIVFWGQDMPIVLLYVHSALETLVVTLCEVVCNLVCSLGWSVWEPIKNAKATYQQRVAWWTRQASRDLGEDDAQEGDPDGELDSLYY